MMTWNEKDECSSNSTVDRLDLTATTLVVTFTSEERWMDGEDNKSLLLFPSRRGPWDELRDERTRKQLHYY